jgi:ribokinase
MSGRVVVVGSLSVDFVMRVPRRPQKGETVAGFDFNTFVGGKGNNQALAAARAGANAMMIGKVGVDDYGDRLIATLEKDNVDTSHMLKDPQSGTGIANIYVDTEGDNSIIIVPRANAALSAEDVRKAKPAIEGAQVVLIQMEIPDQTIVEAAKIGRSVGATVILNPAPAPPSGKLPAGLLEHVDIIVPNQTEAELLTGITASDTKGAEAAARALIQQGAKQVIITLGEQGALHVDADGKTKLIPSFKVKAVDTTAAGDAFCGALAAGLATKKTMERAIEAGCAAGALAVTCSGAEPSLPNLKAIDSLLASAAR